MSCASFWVNPILGPRITWTSSTVTSKGFDKQLSRLYYKMVDSAYLQLQFPDHARLQDNREVLSGQLTIDLVRLDIHVFQVNSS